MSTPAEELHAALGPLVEPLYETLDEAVSIAEAQCEQWRLSSIEYQPVRSHLARALWRHELVKSQWRGELEQWRVNPPQPNTQLALHRQMLSLRMLRPSAGFLPSPGPNVARQVYYRNDSVDLFGPLASNLVALWAPDYDGQMQIRIVRPIGGGARAKQADLSFTLPRSAVDFADYTFTPEDDLGLPLYDLPETEDDEGTGDDQ